MSASLSSIYFDLQGVLYLNDNDLAHNASSFGGIKRRSSLIDTLDGKADLYDTGYSASNRKIKLSVNNAKTEAVNLMKYFVKTYSVMTLILADGNYLCHPQSISEAGKNTTINLLIIEEA